MMMMMMMITVDVGGGGGDVFVISEHDRAFWTLERRKNIGIDRKRNEKFGSERERGT